jgi:hypothetical protein
MTFSNSQNLFAAIDGFYDPLPYYVTLKQNEVTSYRWLSFRINHLDSNLIARFY